MCERSNRFITVSWSLIIFAIFVGKTAASDNPDFTHGLQILSKIARQFLHSQTEDVQIGEGVHLINTANPNDARANMDDGSFIGAMENYLRNHEIRIKLPELMPEEGVGRAFKVVMDGFEANEIGTPRGGGKGGKGGGYGGVMMMGLMMGKMMAALGLGGVGMLAMKALMVSAMALMLSMIIGVKKLVSHDHDDHGGHTVIHASPGHGGYGGYDHRKKREAAEMAYKAWDHLNQS